MLNIKWRQRFRMTRIRSRILAAMIVLSVPSIMLVGFISFNIARDTVVTMNKTSNIDRLRTSSEIADLLFRNINNLHYSIVVNEAIRDEMRVTGRDPQLQPNSQSVTMSTRLQRLISSSYADTRYVKSICLFDLQFQTYCSGRSDDAGIYEGADKVSRITASDWYRSAYDGNGKVVYYPKDVFEEADDSFSTVKLFRDAGDTNGAPIGILVVNVSKGIFGKVFGMPGDYGSYLTLATKDGATSVVFNQKGTASAPTPLTGDIPQTIRELEGQGYLVNPLYNHTTGWTFVHVVQEKELLKQSQTIRWATTAIAAGIAVIALLLSYLLSGTITRPLLRLKKMMLDWTLGTRQFPDSFAKDEVGVIGETFRRIAYENDELTAKLIQSQLKEREAELRALQSQIKPHFLYNTLDSMYWMAILQHNEQVAQMAESLSESFKLSLNKGKETILVYNELKHIEHYLRIQNIRYNGRFRYIEQVEESILGMEMLKLLLQPLVENAIYHGLEPKLGEGTIRLTGVREGGWLLFTVEDDGIGIDDMERIGQGFGLGNVKERLKLYYGEDSSLEVWSRPGEGTRVVLRFQQQSSKKTGHSSEK
ncbi:cache domain-containing sensor histidine kinase [Paenibacillus sp. SYP-B4298]|uniref:cache domain-containing sensor histidine kinase n=1 Tax=Paenibacillus sp. SYP-B4298 TaxID=2996034 RepID=UPI0022DD3D0F|nr:sensor histidine kinase [Paenibacillus sp. SYP-B4298]